MAVNLGLSLDNYFYKSDGTLPLLTKSAVSAVSGVNSTLNSQIRGVCLATTSSTSQTDQPHWLSPQLQIQHFLSLDQERGECGERGRLNPQQSNPGCLFGNNKFYKPDRSTPLTQPQLQIQHFLSFDQERGECSERGQLSPQLQIQRFLSFPLVFISSSHLQD